METRHIYIGDFDSLKPVLAEIAAHNKRILFLAPKDTHELFIDFFTSLNLPVFTDSTGFSSGVFLSEFQNFSNFDTDCWVVYNPEPFYEDLTEKILPKSKNRFFFSNFGVIFSIEELFWMGISLGVDLDYYFDCLPFLVKKKFNIGGNVQYAGVTWSDNIFDFLPLLDGFLTVFYLKFPNIDFSFIPLTDSQKIAINRARCYQDVEISFTFDGNSSPLIDSFSAEQDAIYFCRFVKTKIYLSEQGFNSCLLTDASAPYIIDRYKKIYIFEFSRGLFKILGMAASFDIPVFFVFADSLYNRRRVQFVKNWFNMRRCLNEYSSN